MKDTNAQGLSHSDAAKTKPSRALASGSPCSTHATFLCGPEIFIPSGFPPTFSPRGNDTAAGRIPRGLGAGSQRPGSCRECVSGFRVGQKGSRTSGMQARKNVSARLVGRQGHQQEKEGGGLRVGGWASGLRAGSLGSPEPGHWVTCLGPYLEHCWEPVSCGAQERSSGF